MTQNNQMLYFIDTDKNHTLCEYHRSQLNKESYDKNGRFYIKNRADYIYMGQTSKKCEKCKK